MCNKSTVEFYERQSRVGTHPRHASHILPAGLRQDHSVHKPAPAVYIRRIALHAHLVQWYWRALKCTGRWRTAVAYQRDLESYARIGT